MSNLVSFAKDELKQAGLFDADSDYDGELGKSVLELVETFAKQGHSGGSAAMAMSIFAIVGAFKPLTPLSGADDEWTEVAEENGKPLYQNKRCPTVFKTDGVAYDLNATVLVSADGNRTWNRDCARNITFPYTPQTEEILEGSITDELS